MSIDMQRLLLKEIKEEIDNIDRILNVDCNRVDDKTAIVLLKVHNMLTEDDKSDVGSFANS